MIAQQALGKVIGLCKAAKVKKARNNFSSGSAKYVEIPHSFQDLNMVENI